MVVSQVEGLVTLIVDGIEVEKRVETEEYPRPATVFDLRSTRDDAASVRLVEPVPDEIDVDGVAFHADHGDEHWSKADSTLVFEYELSAGEEYSTLYAIHDANAPLESFMAEPDVEVSGPTEALTERPTRDERPASEDADEAADGPSLEDPSAEEDSVEDPHAVGDSEAEVRTAEASVGDPDRASPTGSAIAGEDDADDGETVAAPLTSPTSSEDGADGVVDELLRELREGAVDEETRAELRSELQLSAGSVDARLRRIQSDVADLRAYTDALETFLDENGSGQQLLEDLRADVERVEDDIASIDARVDSNEDEINSISYSVAEMDGEIDSLDEETGAIEESLSALRGEVESLEADLPDADVSERLREMETQIETVRSWQEHVKSAFEASFDVDTPNGDDS